MRGVREVAEKVEISGKLVWKIKNSEVARIIARLSVKSVRNELIETFDFKGELEESGGFIPSIQENLNPPLAPSGETVPVGQEAVQ